jgi:hypothetical protein
MRAIYFQVEGWKKSGDRLFVGGRNCGDDIRIDDVFSGVGSRSSADRRPTKLRIESILFFRKYMNQLNTGMTAELELSGSIDDVSSSPLDLHGSSPLDLFESFEILGSGDFHSEPS